MELWSKSLWLRIVCPNVSHTSVSWILICLERCRLKSKADGGSSEEVEWGGVKESENRKHGKERKQCTLVPGSFFLPYITASLYLFLSLSLPSLFLSVSLEACQLEPWLPPRELEDRGCVWRSGARVSDREKVRWRERERGRVMGGLNNEVM